MFADLKLRTPRSHIWLCRLIYYIIILGQGVKQELIHLLYHSLSHAVSTQKGYCFLICSKVLNTDRGVVGQLIPAIKLSSLCTSPPNPCSRTVTSVA